MKTLYLLRHAKSSWHDTALSDHERRLNDRGQIAAPFMGEFMKREGLSPSIILTSTAIRARTTAELVKQAGGLTANIIYDEAIYEASPQALMQVISGIDGQEDPAMLVGHNPGMENIIRFLTGRIEPMPTAALAVIELKVETWDMITADTGKLVAVYRPKELGLGADRSDHI